MVRLSELLSEKEARDLERLTSRIRKREKDRERKRDVRAWDRLVGRRSDGHRIRPIAG